jgi:hypothetical protein
METTELQEQTRTVMKAYHAKYPNSTQFISYPDVKYLIECCNNDTGFIEQAIMGLADRTGKDEVPGFKWVSTAVMNQYKEKLAPKTPFTYQELLDKCAFTAHQQIMVNEWKLPEGLKLNGFDDANMKEAFDFLLKTEQIGDEEYRLGMVGIRVMAGEVDLENELHFNKDDSEVDNGIPF